MIDFVLHLSPGATGPASSWAADAAVGDRLVFIARGAAPRRRASSSPRGAAERLLLSGDETALPAICRILGDLPAHARGTDLIEVPLSTDVAAIEAPAGVELVWLPRDGGAVGCELIPAVIAHLGGSGSLAPTEAAEAVWDTARRPSRDTVTRVDGAGIPGLYAWIAGESGVVTTLRRHLVRELGVARDQVAFMGYWRRGVAMRG
ncbi:hypothetical protein GCM10022288_30730 [Gryllotalpicola kribbensis]|uniref:Siderophore-interacting protein n=1 Tax=Gryllotalpicola kribbensis TaxID=993084 RepID=A0ABP8B199_9MICO